MRKLINILSLINLLLLLETGRAATPMEALRIYSVQPEYFELKFMSTMGTGKSTRLAFNHTDGSTHIVSVGDHIGSYTVESYEPTVERIFNPSINAHQEKKGGKVSLKKDDEKAIVLTMGQPLEKDDWTACLVITNTGAWGFAVQGDKLTIGTHTAMVSEVSQEHATMRINKTLYDIPWATEGERATVKSLWDDQRRQQQIETALQQRNIAEQKEEDVLPIHEPLHMPDRQPAFSQRSRLRHSSQSFGVEYSYPIEYDVIPVFVKQPNGKTCFRPIAVPTRFARRKTGIMSFSVTPRY
ncbi:MAG: hypothetical protein ISS35_06245 [Kiritimatiellae bacterium]|nr:hypothetical protein [Kiritimatiellia bacterium]